MALRIFEKNLVNVRKEWHALYAKKADGTFELKLLDLEEYVAGLRSALKKERMLNQSFKAAGVTPDGLAALVTIGGTPKVQTVKTVPDVRAGLLPRRGTLLRG